MTALPAFAIQVSGLYEAEVPVTSQDARERAEAVRTGMQRVLIKLTGNRQAPNREVFSALIRDAEKYVQQYRYTEARRVPGTPAGSGSRLRLRIWFEESGLNTALRDLGVSIWGRERPSVLVWLAMEDENGRRILQLEQDPEYFSIIDQRARDRGITLLFPLFDLEDTSNLRVSDIWGGFHDQVMDASRRYYPDIVLTAKIMSPLEGIWEGLWTAYFGEEARTWTTQGSFPETVLNEGIDAIVDMLATQFVSGSSLESTDIRLRVVDIINAEQYTRVLDYLGSLSPVTQVDVVQVSKGDIMFNITAHGGEQAVIQAINFGRLLEPVDEARNIYRLLR